MDLRVLMRESPASHDTLVQARYPCRQDRGCPITANSELPDTVPRMVSMMNSELHNSVGAGRYDETGNYTSTFGGPGLSATATVRHRVYSMEGSYLYQFGTVTVGNWHSQVSMMNCTTVSGLAEYPYYRLHGPITNNCELPETVPRMVQFYMAVNVRIVLMLHLCDWVQIYELVPSNKDNTNLLYYYDETAVRSPHELLSYDLERTYVRTLSMTPDKDIEDTGVVLLKGLSQIHCD
ncbi:hypothetical protein Bbelb_303850 [Branchiostoma belcheri]|nr:hypothetical protein Bbelb_303850 [Branchiostoma belcheri]